MAGRAFGQARSFAAEADGAPLQDGVLDLGPSFGEVKQWHVQGQKDEVSRKTINAFMDSMVDLCDESTVDLPEMTRQFFYQFGFMFLQTDGTVKDLQKKRHDGWMRWVKVKRQQAQMDPDYASHYESQMWRGLARMTGYRFDATLGDHMASGFKENPIECYRMALKAVEYCPCHLPLGARQGVPARHPQDPGLLELGDVQLQIFKNYCLDKGGCGKLLRYVGCTPQKKRDVTLQRFLRDPNERGMLFMSSAGSVGTNVSPGCFTCSSSATSRTTTAARASCPARPLHRSAGRHQDPSRRLRAAVQHRVGEAGPTRR